MASTRVLLVEDSAVQRRLLSRLLLACGAEVVTAENGHQAIGLAESAPPSLILMDIDLPGLDGLDACRALKRNPRTRHVPVVMLSGCEEKACRLRALMRGAADYLVKPVSRSQLCELLHAINPDGSIKKVTG